VIVGEGPYADLLRTMPDSGCVWIAQQTYTAPDGAPYHDAAFEYVNRTCARLEPATLVVVSTQLPVGSCARLEALWPDLRFAVQPENIRVASAAEDWANTRKFVLGSCHDLRLWADRIFGPDRTLHVTPESAEMTKHAINGFLAVAIRYGNDIGRLCDLYGADPGEVVAGLRADRRVGDAPISPGGPPSQHLLREVHTLIELGAGPVVRASL